jgi:hypothetical protein
MARKANSKFAVTSLSLGLVGWVVYTLQWCFDLTLGILLAAFTAGISAVFLTVLDIIPFILWLAGIVIGHMALSQIKRSGGGGRSRAVCGLLLNYLGLFFSIIFNIVIIILILAGAGMGFFNHIFPLIHK